ncbi:MAG TPA: hypothetical protein IAB39_10370 [Candidatus Onthovicinus excrementipullorum]|nr:hypothetical protein [Candidatus Onthovicinus excrementipullorum]
MKKRTSARPKRSRKKRLANGKQDFSLLNRYPLYQDSTAKSPFLSWNGDFDVFRQIDPVVFAAENDIIVKIKMVSDEPAQKIVFHNAGKFYG